MQVTTDYGPAKAARVLPRHAARPIGEALGDTRVVLVIGARQCGKSTLVSGIGRSRNASWRSLDNAPTRHAAINDPSGFVTEAAPMIIDEIQRVPELLLSIKELVDADPAPGRFLLTGSARVMDLATVPDALPGRLETIELWPLSQGEIDTKPDQFVDAVFAEGAGLQHTGSETRADYTERILRGGFPEAIRRTGTRRARFFTSYVADLINRDVLQIADIQHKSEMRALVELIAARSGNLLVPGNLSTTLGLARNTVVSYVRLLEEVFLIKRIPAWSRNTDARAVATPKVFVVDSGIAAALNRFNPAALRAVDGPLGPLLEGFVLSELSRQLTWSADPDIRLSHYRTKDGVEVDAVLENSYGQIVGIEIKATASVRGEDFRGLRHLQARAGKDFLAGFVLHLGTQSLPFGRGLRALPVSALWELAPSGAVKHSHRATSGPG